MTHEEHGRFARPLRVPRHWTGGDSLHSYPESRLDQLVEQQATRTPDSPALRAGSTVVTYAQLIQRAQRLASALRRREIGRHDRVAVCLDRSVEQIVSVLAVLLAGATYVPVDPRGPLERRRFMLNDSGPRAVLTSAALAHSISAAVRVPVVDVDAEALTDGGAPPWPGSSGTVHDLAYVIYTSGSTGVPKGVLNTHCGVSNHLAWMGEAFPLSTADRVLAKTPAVFDVSLWEWFWPLSQGACLVLTPPGSEKEPLQLLDAIESQRITNIHFVPTMLRLMLERSDLQRCQTIERVFCSGEALTSEIRDRFFERFPGSPALINLYGPTEAAVHVTGWVCRRGETGAVPIGRALPNVACVHRRRGPQSGGRRRERRAADWWRADRLWLSPTPRAHTRAIHSGSLRQESGGALLQDGRLRLVARRWRDRLLRRYDSQVQLGGVRVEIGEIEAALRRHPDVGDAAVLVHETNEPTRLVAYLRRAPGKGSRPDPPVDSVRRVLAETLPDYMMPASYKWLDSFPVTPTGKLDRGALPDADAVRPAMEQTFELPLAGTEARLAGLWSDQLRIDRIGRHDDFRVLGGDSIASLRVIAAIANEFGVELAPGEFLRSPTIARLATRLETSGARTLAPTSIVTLRAGHTGGAALFLPPSMGGELDYWRELISLLAPGRPVYGFTVPDGFAGPAVEIRTLAAAMVRDLVAFQPGGPYHLAGYSFSAALALEIAQQLRASGRTVGLLAMIDYGPGARPSWLGRARTVGYFFTNLPRWLSDDIRLAGWRAVGSRAQRKLATFGQKVATVGRRTTEQLAEWAVDEMYANDALSRTHRRLIVDHLAAFFRYEPAPYDGRVTLFRARSRPLFHSLDPSLGWEDYSTGGCPRRLGLPAGELAVRTRSGCRRHGPARRAHRGSRPFDRAVAGALARRPKRSDRRPHWTGAVGPRRADRRRRGADAVRRRRLRRLLLVDPPRGEPRSDLPARMPSRCCRTGATCPSATTGARARWW